MGGSNGGWNEWGFGMGGTWDVGREELSVMLHGTMESRRRLEEERKGDGRSLPIGASQMYLSWNRVFYVLILRRSKPKPIER